MTNLTPLVRELRQQRDRMALELEKLNNALAVLSTLTARTTGLRKRTGQRKGRTMSAAGRRKIASAQRARWAKFRAAKKAR